MARFLVKMNAVQGQALAADTGRLLSGGFVVTPLMPNLTAASMGVDGAAESWFLATTQGEVEPGDAWDECHARLAVPGALGVAPGAVSYAEPDIVQPFTVPDEGQVMGLAADAVRNQKEQYWMKQEIIPHGDRFDWHLEDDYSGLRKARNAVVGRRGKDWRVSIGHLDTGYAQGHQLLPDNLQHGMERSFVEGENFYSAVDPFVTGPLLKNPGHGTGTLCLLAGGRLDGLQYKDENRPDKDYLGGAPHAHVIPVRIASSVVLMRTSAFVRGLDYLLAPDGDEKLAVNVVSMSMGGLCSAAWTDIVNRAYDRGVVLCTAAGNHYAPLLPNSIVYPARYRRVIAACGVMADGRPYADLPTSIMCGCYGPDSKMATAIAAYSPNIPWAQFDHLKAFRWNGEGTSSATPQVAAASALYFEQNYEELMRMEGWARVEAVRRALFQSARQHQNGSFDKRLGNGILNAAAALETKLADPKDLKQLPPDSASFPFLHVLTGFGIDTPVSTNMLQVEVLQLTQQHAALASILADPEETKDTDPKIRDFLSAITSINEASKHLKAAVSLRLKRGSVNVLSGRDEGVAVAVGGGGAPAAATWKPPVPPCRKLRGYVFDPSMATRLQYVALSQTTYRIRWESGDFKLGPEGEYLQVIDDGQDLIDLNDPHLLAQDGLEPSECSPQFRQQMVYAVGMQIIDVFESALGRTINWAPLDNGNFNEKLKLFPHGVQAPNAFYSPRDRAIYFGYFRAKEQAGDAYSGMVYTSLSHDIIAHEMTHALLDGIHSSFREPSNPDVLAFHEAFADLVALLQQFANVDVVRSQSAAVKGDLSMENLLGNLAAQFGAATKGRAALRSGYLTFNDNGTAVPTEPDPTKLRTTSEAYERGSVLVAAIYRAFLSIYKTRTVDLYRIASNGRSETPLHLLSPDLVNRIALEASRSARHVLRMCIRAIDYCPPVDLTFGDFLRALVTADADVVPDDTLHYRVAFIESFRKSGIYPKGLQALSSETLVWPRISLKAKLPQIAIDTLNQFAQSMSLLSKRRDIFDKTREASEKLEEGLEAFRKNDPTLGGLAEELGLVASSDPAFKLKITRLRFSHKTSPAGTVKYRALVSIVQTHGNYASGIPIRWGLTLVFDLSIGQVIFHILKPYKDTSDPVTAQNAESANTSALLGFAMCEPFMLLHQE